MYYYNESTQLYTQIEINELSGKIREQLQQYFGEQINTSAANDIKGYCKVLDKIGDFSFITKVAKSLAVSIYNADFQKKLDATKHVVNFSNGLYNLKTGKFAPRTQQDYYTKCLNYNYT